jgi:hypothetical protein
VAVVTGANRGIGHALAARLAEHGLTVVLTARDDDRGEAAAAPLRDRGLPVVYRRLDVSDPASVAAFADWLRDTLGGLDILVRHQHLPPPVPASMSMVSASFPNQSQIFGAPSPKLFRPFAMDIHRDSTHRRASSSVALGDRSWYMRLGAFASDQDQPRRFHTALLSSLSRLGHATLHSSPPRRPTE